MRVQMREDTFVDIAEDTIRRAEQIDTDFDTFVEGLKHIAEEVRVRLDMAEDEQRSR